METQTLLNGRYRLGPRIGSGGMADVHRATDQLLARDVAVKLLRGSDADRDRLAAEACTVAGLNHPGIVTVLDAGLEEDRPFLVMELVDGPTLAQALGQGPLDPERVRAIGQQLAAALAHAHAEGIVHRDVKPGNVLLRPDGTACLADFGIACLVDGTRAESLDGQVIGSPAYVAPEQVALEDVGPAADVYSLGLVLLEALTGRRAFAGTGVEVAYARIRAAPPIPVSLGPTWVSALAAMTARSPHDRPAAAAVVGMLAGPADGPEVATAAFGAVPERPRARAAWAARVALALAAGLAGSLLLVGFADSTDRAGVVPPGRPSASAVAHQQPTTRATATPAPRPVAATRHVSRAPHRAHHHRKRTHGRGHAPHRHR